MENLVIPVNINNDYWRKLLEIIDCIKPFSLLEKREKDVLSILLELAFKYKDLDASERSKLVFNVKKKIMELYKISSIEIINNKLTSLRKKDIILIDKHGNNYIDPKFLNKFKEVTFRFIDKNNV
jgi:hypothetical protein